MTVILIRLQLSGSIKWIHGSQKVPYNSIARHLMENNKNNLPVFTTWYNGIGRTVNYYLTNPDYVKDFRQISNNVTSDFILLFRPNSSEENNALKKLVAAGWEIDNSKHYGGE